MSDIRLNTVNDITLFLKILAEESVREAKKTVDSDPLQKEIEDGIASDKKVFGHISEDDAQEEEIDEPREEVIEEPEESGEAQTQDLPSPQDATSEIDISAAKLVKLINRIRSGRAIKGPVRDEFDDYADDVLEPEDRQWAAVLLQSIGDVVLQLSKGAEAKDPGDIAPPEPKHVEEPEPEKIEQEPTSTAGKKPGVEDTSPPIRVGESIEESSTRMSEIRKRVIELMKA